MDGDDPLEWPFWRRLHHLAVNLREHPIEILLASNAHLNQLYACAPSLARCTFDPAELWTESERTPTHIEHCTTIKT